MRRPARRVMTILTRLTRFGRNCSVHPGGCDQAVHLAVGSWEVVWFVDADCLHRTYVGGVNAVTYVMQA